MAAVIMPEAHRYCSTLFHICRTINFIHRHTVTFLMSVPFYASHCLLMFVLTLILDKRYTSPSKKMTEISVCTMRNTVGDEWRGMQLSLTLLPWVWENDVFDSLTIHCVVRLRECNFHFCPFKRRISGCFWSCMSLAQNLFVHMMYRCLRLPRQTHCKTQFTATCSAI